MKVLVTGGGGYVGNVLCRYLLLKGHKVRCVDNFHKKQCDALLGIAGDPNFEFQYGDVTNIEHCHKMVEDVDGIIHLAGIVGFPQCKANPALSHAVNVEGVSNIMAARNILDPNIRFVYASTGSVYGQVKDICTENSPLNAQSLYGIQKKMAEDIVSSNINTVSFRFATGFGLSPSMRVNLLVNDFVYQALTNRALIIFQADFRRTFIHVRDMARAFHFGLVNTDMKHKVYNCGANELNWTKRELAEYIKEQTKCHVFYGEIGRDEDQRDYAVSYDRLNNEGWTIKIPMEDGIQELVRATPILKIHHQYE